jgi:ABC-type transport system substrate-binding protein
MMAYDKYMDILNKRAVLGLGADYGQKGVVGTGPFKFKEWVQGDHITIVRNDNYWGTPAYLDAITFRAIPETSTRLIAFKTGDVDFLIDPPLKDVKGMMNDPQVQVKTCDSGDEKVFYLNTSKPPFDNKKVRQAIFYAIDRQAIIDNVYYGFGTKGQGIFPPWHWAFDPQANFYPYDPDKAKQMLAEAGYNDANPLRFEIVTSDVTDHVDMSTLIQAQLAKIGVKVTITQVDKAAHVAKTWPVKGSANPAYQASVYRFKHTNLTTDLSWRIYSSKTPTNLFGYNQPGGYQNPDVEKMMDAAWVITDREKAVQAYRQISQTITDDAPVLVLGWLKIVNVANSNVKGLGCWVRNDWPLQTVWIDK